MRVNRIKILVAEPEGFSARAASQLSEAADLVLDDLDRQRLLSAVQDFDVLWIRLRHQIDAELLDRAARLKTIVTPTTGLDHIDLAETNRRGIHVLSLRGEIDFLRDIHATAEHTIALILSLLRHIPQACAHARYGDWNRDLFRGRELHGKTVGIVGYGRLGGLVARYLRAFGTKILVTDPKIHTDQAEAGIVSTSLLRLLHESDLVTLHVNLCDETTGFFGRKQFAAMKPGAWFINTSRGELVDESALLDALSTRQLAGAAVDVLCGERSAGMAEHPLIVYSREHTNLLVTPHIGGCTAESMEKSENFLAQRLVSSLQSNLDKSRGEEAADEREVAKIHVGEPVRQTSGWNRLGPTSSRHRLWLIAASLWLQLMVIIFIVLETSRIKTPIADWVPKAIRLIGGE